MVHDGNSFMDEADPSVESFHSDGNDVRKLHENESLKFKENVGCQNRSVNASDLFHKKTKRKLTMKRMSRRLEKQFIGKKDYAKQNGERSVKEPVVKKKFHIEKRERQNKSTEDVPEAKNI